MPTILAMLPAYNEEASLTPLLEQFCDLRLPAGWNMRVTVVNDGSKDNTAEVVRRFVDNHRPGDGHRCLDLHLVDHAKNQGLGAAIRTGLTHYAASNYNDDDVVVCMDADNTHAPSYMLAMIEKLNAGADLVIASRYQKGSQEIGVPANRLVYSRGARLLFALTLRLPGVRDYTCGYRAIRLGLIRRALSVWGDRLIEGQGFACTDELLVKMARLRPAPKLAEIPFILRYDLKRGASKLPLMKTIMATLKLCLIGHEPPKK